MSTPPSLQNPDSNPKLSPPTNLLSLPDPLLSQILHEIYIDSCTFPGALQTIQYQSRRLYALSLPFIYQYLHFNFNYRIEKYRVQEEREYELLMRSLRENETLLRWVRVLDVTWQWPRSKEGECELVRLLVGEGEEGEGGGGGDALQGLGEGDFRVNDDNLDHQGKKGGDEINAGETAAVAENSPSQVSISPKRIMAPRKFTRKDITFRGWCATGPGEGTRCVYYSVQDWKWYLGWD